MNHMKRRIWLWVGSSLLLLIGLTYAATSVAAYQAVAYVCENTGSSYGYHLWPGGYRTDTWSRQSPLEICLTSAQPGLRIEHRWSRCSNMGTTILGNHISFADGRVGGMVRLHDAEMQVWLDHHSRADAINLYEFFRTATLDQSTGRAEAIEEEVQRYE